MKTTIEIDTHLLRKAKSYAAEHNTTLRRTTEAALQRYLDDESKAKPFKLKDGSVRGHGVQPGIELNNWKQIRKLLYEENEEHDT
jgi:hypothetical protein